MSLNELHVATGTRGESERRGRGPDARGTRSQRFNASDPTALPLGTAAGQGRFRRGLRGGRSPAPSAGRAQAPARGTRRRRPGRSAALAPNFAFCGASRIPASFRCSTSATRKSAPRSTPWSCSSAATCIRRASTSTRISSCATLPRPWTSCTSTASCTRTSSLRTSSCRGTHRGSSSPTSVWRGARVEGEATPCTARSPTCRPSVSEEW